MKARTLLTAIAGAVISRRWVCVPAAMALALVLGPGAAVAAGHDSPAPVCPVVQRPLQSITVPVPATAGPTVFPGATGPADTGVCVRRAVQVTATRTIGTGGGTAVGPDGDTTTLADSRYPLPGVPRWSLIGRIGNGPWRYIGAGPTALVGNGELYLAVNDDVYGDNDGAFTTAVSRCVCGTRCGLFETDLADDTLSGLAAACFEQGASSPQWPSRPRP